jgi:hypothetical protein
MTIRPISDGTGGLTPPYNRPSNLQTLSSSAEASKIKTHFFSITSVLTLPPSGEGYTTSYELPVQYYFKTGSASTASRWGHEFVELWDTGVASALPDAWKSTVGGYVVANDHAVQICIEKISVV